jgi:5-oxopent-3-ene-1,2,5-tricarboxylate decarboxylase/2-hydroxyhepta-2,4-diene-1,7-dioate isomerase
VFGAQATRVPEARALEAVRGFTVVADLSLPHTSLHRPPIREKCFDGACPIGPWVVAREQIGDPDALEVLVHVNAELRARRSLRGLVRSIPRLIADVTEFLTLYPGDMLLAGIPVSNPSARPGDSVAVEIPGVGLEADRPTGNESDRWRHEARTRRLTAASTTPPKTAAPAARRRAPPVGSTR